MKKALESKALFSSVVEAGPKKLTAYHFMYAIHTRHHDYHAAADSMYRLALRAIEEATMLTAQGEESKSRECFRVCHEALAVACMTLKQLPKQDKSSRCR